MFSVDMDNGLVKKSLDDLRLEIGELKAEAARMRQEHDLGLQRCDELRNQSIEARPINPDMAETLWNEAEALRDASKECMRQSIEKTMRAADIQHRIDIRAQIEAIDNYDTVWRDAVRAGRS
jgi:hypothetical protein